jgi:hypothetical protein
MPRLGCWWNSPNSGHELFYFSSRINDDPPAPATTDIQTNLLHDVLIKYLNLQYVPAIKLQTFYNYRTSKR